MKPQACEATEPALQGFCPMLVPRNTLDALALSLPKSVTWLRVTLTLNPRLGRRTT